MGKQKRLYANYHRTTTIFMKTYGILQVEFDMGRGLFVFTDLWISN